MITVQSAYTRRWNFVISRCFVAVAELGSISRAAQKLFIAQPPLSLQIKQLEEEIRNALADPLPAQGGAQVSRRSLPRRGQGNSAARLAAVRSVRNRPTSPADRQSYFDRSRITKIRCGSFVLNGT